MSGDCKCSLRTRLVGDGCSICNADYWADKFDEDSEDNESDGEPIPYIITPAGRAALEGKK